jgi:hypothetical protein
MVVADGIDEIPLPRRAVCVLLHASWNRVARSEDSMYHPRTF